MTGLSGRRRNGPDGLRPALPGRLTPAHQAITAVHPGRGRAGVGEPCEQIARLGDLLGTDYQPAQTQPIAALGSHGTPLYGGAVGAEPAGPAVSAGSADAARCSATAIALCRSASLRSSSR